MAKEIRYKTIEELSNKMEEVIRHLQDHFKMINQHAGVINGSLRDKIVKLESSRMSAEWIKLPYLEDKVKDIEERVAKLEGKKR